jgi:septin family protein
LKTFTKWVKKKNSTLGNKSVSRPKNIKPSQQTKIEEKSNINILVCGTSDAGKTCLFEQIKRFDNSEEKENYLDIVYSNLLRSTSIILNSEKEHLFDDPDNLDRTKIFLKLVDFNRSKDFSELYTKEIHLIMNELWKEKCIVEKFEESGHILQ